MPEGSSNFIRDLVLAVLVAIALGTLAFFSDALLEHLELVKRQEIEAMHQAVRGDSESSLKDLQLSIETRLRDAGRQISQQIAEAQRELREKDKLLAAKINAIAALPEPFLGTNTHVSFYEETSAKAVTAEISSPRKAVVFITAYAKGVGNDRVKPASLAVEIRVDGEICAKSKDTIDRKNELDFFVSTTCLRSLIARPENYRIEAIAQTNQVTKSEVKLRYVIFEEIIKFPRS